MRIPPLALAAFVMLGACVPRPAPAPPPAKPADAPPPAAEPAAPATWRYTPSGPGSAATYSAGGAADLVIGCDAVARQITLSRAGAGSGPMTLRTSSGEASWPAHVVEGRTVAILTATDPALDRMAFSRGRFTVRVVGLPDLEAPAWAEPARVIEECRTPRATTAN
jgi:hypothetical protein